ncbi:MAG TPA: ankyrin repeat domain-containing protein [Tepidisphaeraceae bacterium]|nr:ankyrin repeat domain-containing protein [Tepidisphaeraceae bacterium]
MSRTMRRGWTTLGVFLTVAAIAPVVRAAEPQADTKWWTVPAEARTAFLEACARGDEQAVARFLKPYPSLVHARGTTHDRGTGLIVAAWEGKPEVIRVLLQNGADLEAEDRVWGASALGWAAYWGRAPTVQALLEAKADPNHPNRNGRTPLYNAKAGDRAHPGQVSAKAREQVAQLLTAAGGTEETQERKRPWPPEVPPQEKQILGEQDQE